jgi:predicted CXXCH cytochrome family protein
VHRVRGPLEKAEVISLKRFSLVLFLSLAISLALVGSAFANFGPHGGYATDTDSCAGCHRAHTSFSAVRFEPSSGPGPDPSAPASESALLVGGAATMQEFCYACHGDAAPGAATNVQGGVFDAGPSTASMAATNATHPYQTASTFNAPLNGGGFDRAAKDWDWNTADVLTAQYAAVSSAHSMEKTSVMWGAGNGVDVSQNMTCTSCHDPHGSSNYRLLKDKVNGLTVGGYTEFGVAGGSNYDLVPNPYVMSVENGYPAAGWSKGMVGAGEMADYKPDYTRGTPIRATQSGGKKSLSMWCSSCHVNYNDKSGEKLTALAGSTGAVKNYGTYEANGTVGAKTRHRHPVDIAVQSGDGILQVDAQKYSMDTRIPLEEAPGTASYRNWNVGCLTCHLAHGSSQDMTGWAAASLVGTPTSSPTSWFPVMDGVPGVDPDKADYAGHPGTSSLLRADSRGVCERCHNK